MLEPATILLALSGVFLIAFMKGSFGGGFAIVGIPLLALVMDPLTAGALLAPLFVAMDVFALRYWKPATWSKPDLAVLLPGLVAGIVAGTLLLSVLDGRAVAIIILITYEAHVGGTPQPFRGDLASRPASGSAFEPVQQSLSVPTGRFSRRRADRMRIVRNQVSPYPLNAHRVRFLPGAS